ncbi:MAG: hypothetical protein IJS14_07080 [Lentisphaeria bacterium]|nr:hypothetical protein [Lentisphaeria bacterium]
MILRFLPGFALLVLPLFLSAAEVLDFVPPAARMVFRIDLAENLPGLNDVREDLLTTVSRQSGFDEKNNKSSNISKLLQEITVVTPNLTEDYSFVVVKTKVTEQVFCSELEKMTGVQPKSVKTGKTSEYRMAFANFGVGSVLAPKQRTFAFAFVADKIAVFSKDSLERFRSFQKLGLDPKDRKLLLVPKTIAAGFVKMDPEFLLENPLLPPFDLAVTSLAAGPAGSLVVNMSFTAADKPAAKQLQKYLQQMVMVGAMLLNQTDEDLMQEWMTSVKVKREENTVLVKGVFTRFFIDRLAGMADRQMREPEPPKTEKKQ